MCYYRILDDLKAAIEQNRLCTFHLNTRKDMFVPLLIQPSPYSGRNIMIGISEDKSTVQVAEFSAIRHFILHKQTVSITKKDMKKAQIAFWHYLENDGKKAKVLE